MKYKQIPEQLKAQIIDFMTANQGVRARVIAERFGIKLSVVYYIVNKHNKGKRERRLFSKEDIIDIVVKDIIANGRIAQALKRSISVQVIGRCRKYLTIGSS